MKRPIFLLLVFSCYLSGGSMFMGQKVYLKECRTCHMGSNIFLKTHTYNEWSKVLDEGGESLAHLHLSKDVQNVNSKDGTIKDSHEYFKSDEYRETYKNLKLFIMQSAKNKGGSFYN